MKNIVIIDDDSQLRESLKELLLSEQYNVSLAKDPMEAIDIAKGKVVDLFIVDLVMPAGGGMVAISNIKVSHPNAIIVMVTAFATVENAVEFMKKGVDHYITKPFRFNELLITIKRLFEEQRLSAKSLLPEMSSIFDLMASPIRRDIIHLLTANPMKFMDITRQLGISDHTKVNFHLKVMKDAEVIDQDPTKCYRLTDIGIKISRSIEFISRTFQQ